MMRPLAAPGQTPVVRWDFGIRADNAPGENGDLRFDAPGPRILLAHADTRFEPLTDYHRRGDSIFFDTRRFRGFAGRVTDTLMSGTARAGDGAELHWFALPIMAGRTSWPVPPRVTIRQLVLGRPDSILRISGDWIAALPSPADLNTEEQRLAEAAGLPATIDRGDGHVQRVLFGIDSAARTTGVALLRRAVDSTGAPALRGIFLSPAGICFDRYDHAVRAAHEYLVGFSLDAAVRGMHELHLLDRDSSDAGVRAALIALRDVPTKDPRLDALQRVDDAAAQSLHALITAYDDSGAWWNAAVHALMTQRWLRTDAGWQSPAGLMATFWGVDSLPLPRITARATPGQIARPVIDGSMLMRHLLQADNAVAPEWIAGDGVRRAFEVWRAIDWGAPLPILRGASTRVALSPSQLSHAMPMLFGDEAGVEIDPAVTPLAAVAIIMHEWEHLVIAERRFAGPHPRALRESGVEVELLDDNPWLAEGFAEWATDATLAPAGAWSAWSRYTQAVKRNALVQRAPDDPHLLGYRLVIALRARWSAARLRGTLVDQLDDLPAIARLSGLAASVHASARVIRRQPSAAVVPEVTFAWNGETAIDLSHRLLIPLNLPEH